jgi:F-type H+-transporting ATPase subunit b
VNKATQHLRVPVGLRWLVFAAFLIAQTAAMPLRAMAQEPVPDAASQPAAGDEVSEKQIEKDEEKGENAYRHSAMIKAAARVLHLSTETTARSFEIINIAIVVLGLGIPLYRFLPKYLRGRAEKVSSDIESARKVTEDANTRLSAVEAKLAHLDEEIQKFRAEMEAEMHADETRIKAAIEEESARIVASAEQEIGVAAAQARRGLRHFAADLAIEQAAKQIVLTPETDRALIAEFVSDVGKGGMN